MPQRRTAKKALRQNRKKQQRNLIVKSQAKLAIKKLKKSLEGNDPGLCQKALAEVYKVLDKAATKKIIHKNKAARRKSRLSKLVNKSGSKSTK